MSDKIKARQATEIWRILDNLAATNPTAYRKIIKEQMDLGKSITSPPKPEILIRAKTYDKNNPFIFVLLCSWSRITKNQNAEEPLNVIGGEPYEVNDDLGDKQNSITKLYALAFSDETVSELLKNERNQLELIDTSLEYINTKNKVRINTDTMYEICQNSLIGCIDSLYTSFKYEQFDPESEFKNYFGDLTKKPDLLAQISQRCTDSDSDDKELTELSLPLVRNTVSHRKGAPVLIEECRGPVVQVSQTSGSISVNIVLDSVRSIDDIELDVSPIALHLEVPVDKSFKPLNIEFPEPVCVNSCRVTFKRKSRKLSIVAKMK